MPRLLQLALAFCFAAPLHAEIEFIGVLVTPQLTRFALADTATGKTDWIARGRLFAGYTVSSYDAANDTLTLTRGGTELRIRLKDDAKVKASRLELTGAITFGTDEKLEIERATLQFDQENVFPLKDGLIYRITPTRLEDGTIRYDVAIERRLAENKTEKVSAPAIIALAGRPFRIHVGEFGFAFTPR